MELTTKDDWQEGEDRMNAWWAGEVIDRPVIQVRSPRAGIDKREWQAIGSPGALPPDQAEDWYTDVEQVVERGERFVDATFWGGEAFPVVFPVAVHLVAITSAYLGCPYHIDHNSHSGWAEPIINDWSQRVPIKFTPDNEWWQLSKTLLDAAARRAEGRYYVGMPDLNAPGELVALLRDTQRFLYDFMDDPAPIKPAIDGGDRGLVALLAGRQRHGPPVDRRLSLLDGHLVRQPVGRPPVRLQRHDLAADV
jgi:hypothetical protein